MSGTMTPTSDRRYVATNLEAVLATQGRKSNWLAERAGVSTSLISKILEGKRTADQQLADRIADALGVPIGLLFEFHERNETDSHPEHAA